MLILLAIFFSAAGFAQGDSSLQLIKIIKGGFSDFSVDNLGNILLLDSNNQLKKLGPDGDSVAIYNDVRKYGKVFSIDAGNPLKILLYYRDFGTIVVLDRLLNVRTTIDLRKQNIFQAKAIGQSYDNKIWVYDEVENKLKKIDEEGALLQETPDFRQLFDPAPLPRQVFDEDQFVYLYDSSLAVYVFDYYGAIKNKILINHWQNFKVTGKFIFGSNANTLYRYNIKTFRVEEWKLPAELFQAKSFNFTSSRLYALRKDNIAIFNFH